MKKTELAEHYKLMFSEYPEIINAMIFKRCLVSVGMRFTACLKMATLHILELVGALEYLKSMLSVISFKQKAICLQILRYRMMIVLQIKFIPVAQWTEVFALEYALYIDNGPVRATL